jgi:putative SOS response-associated peptidase YedK
MCGRYSNDKGLDDMAKAYQAAGGKGDDFMAAWTGMFSLAPTDRVPIVREELDDETIKRELQLARWDFRPHWRKEPRPLINARLESVAEKPTFREAFASRRAIVPMTGYYEWTGPPKAKTPHYISAGGELLSAAGLYEFRKLEEIDEWEISCVVITRTGVDAAGEVHDRMPVFMTPDVWADWLAPEKLTNKAGAVAMLDHSSNSVAATLGSWVVDRRVNSVHALDPHDRSIIEPVGS